MSGHCQDIVLSCPRIFFFKTSHTAGGERTGRGGLEVGAEIGRLNKGIREEGWRREDGKSEGWRREDGMRDLRRGGKREDWRREDMKKEGQKREDLRKGGKRED